jgi:hypothetical protein
LTHAVLGLVLLLLATGLVLLGTIRVARAFGLTDTIDLAVAASVLAATQIVLTLLFVGVVLRSLELASVLIVTAVVSGTALVVARPRRRGRPTVRTMAKRAAAACRSHPLAAVLAVVAGIALAWRLVLALFIPPYGYDALAYHLMSVVYWLQVDRVTTSPLNLCCAYYPQNGELQATWPAVLGGRLEFVDLVQIAWAIAGAFAVAGIARAARLRSPGPWIAASLFLVTPVLLAQANTSYVDLTFTAEAVCALYLVLRFLETQGRARWFLLGCAGAATALCLGTKAEGVVFTVGIGLPLLVRALLRPRWTWPRVGLETAVFGLPIAVLGASWYIRSWISKGNPFHPMYVAVAGKVVFNGRNHLSGPPPDLVHHSAPVQTLLSWYSDLHFWTKNGYPHGGALGGLGPVWSYFGAILTIAFAVYAWRRQRTIFWFFLVPMGILFVFQPDRWSARYTMTLAAVGAVSVAWALSTAWRPVQLRFALGLATLALAIGGAWIASREILPGWRFQPIQARTILSDIAHGRRTVGQVFDSDYAWVDHIRSGSRIAIDVTTVHLNAPFAGVRFQNQLQILPRQADLEAFVRAHHSDYVVTIYHSHYNKQAEDMPGMFKSLGGRRVRAYRVEHS